MNARTDDGFTLVETLMTLVLLGLMSVLTIGMFQQLRTVRAIEVRYREESEVSAVLAHVTNELSRALPIPLSGSDPDLQQSLIGTPTSVQFVATTRDGFRTDGLREINFALEEHGDQYFLMRRTRSRSYTNETVKAVLDDVKSLNIEYRSGSNDSEWAPDWQRRRTLPFAVKVGVTLSNGEQHSRVVVIY